MSTGFLTHFPYNFVEGPREFTKPTTSAYLNSLIREKSCKFSPVAPAALTLSSLEFVGNTSGRFKMFVRKFICVFSLLCFSLTEAGAPDFPDGFLIGFATSSYQIEGAWDEEGKGENIWDRLVHTKPYMVADQSNGDVACDSFHKFREDVQLLKHVGADVYRFSLSWSRILPKGDISVINEAGIKYYDQLINELLKNNIQPMVTLYHWDLPQPLQDLGGWPNPVMVDYFEDYATLAFQKFGDRVKLWITFNEPLEVCLGGYGRPIAAPAVDIPGVAEYLCAHTVIKAHARAYHVYDKEFRKAQKGNVTITLNGEWCEPLTDSKEDKEAAETAMEFHMGWFLRPLIKGDYPLVMRKRIDANSKLENRKRSRLPHFSGYWRNYIKGTIDFLGINHYTTVLVEKSKNEYPVPSYDSDLNVSFSQNSSWPDSSVVWLRVEPTGFRKKLNWLKAYLGNNDIPIFVTENGYADWGELNDSKRIYYYSSYLGELLKAMNNDGCNVIGYTGWSLIDNFEWLSGYIPKFGVYHVNFTDPNLRRTPKASVEFFKQLLRTRKLPCGGKDQCEEVSNPTSLRTEWENNQKSRPEVIAIVA